MAEQLTVAERRRRAAERACAERRRRAAERAGAATIFLAGPAPGLVFSALTGAWLWLVLGAVLLLLARLGARHVARSHPPRAFAEACCHRAGGTLRAGPPRRPSGT